MKKLILILFLFSRNFSFGQQDGGFWQDRDMILPFTYQLLNISKNKIINDCLDYLNDTAGRSNTKFKSVTERKFMTLDSVKRNKIFISNEQSIYNKLGQKMKEVDKDSLGKVIGIWKLSYDTKGNLLKELEYNKEYSPNKRMQLYREFTNVYDKRGNLIRFTDYCRLKDSPTKLKLLIDHIWTYDDRDNVIVDSALENNYYLSSSNEDTGYVIVHTHITYNAHNDITRECLIWGGDTTILEYKYDFKNRATDSRFYENGIWATEQHDYDTASNIKNIEFNEKDSNQPSSRQVAYKYYGDNITVKEERIIESKNIITIQFGTDSREEMKKIFCPHSCDSGISINETVWEYKSW